MSEREWLFYLDDMIDFAEKVLTYSEGLDQQAFCANSGNNQKRTDIANDFFRDVDRVLLEVEKK